MEGPPLGPGGEDITWPDQVAPRGRKASSTRKIKPQTSNLIWMPSKMKQGVPKNFSYIRRVTQELFGGWISDYERL